MSKLLVVKFPPGYDTDELGSWLCEVQRNLKPNYQVVAIPNNFDLYCPDKDDCVHICEELLDMLYESDREEIVRRLQAKYLTQKGEKG